MNRGNVFSRNIGGNIEERLKKYSLKDRAFLKEYLTVTHEKILKYMEDKIYNLEKNILEEIYYKKNEKEISIHTLVCLKENSYQYEDFFEEIIEDKEKNIAKNFVEEEYLESVFIDTDYFSIPEIVNKKYIGTYIKNDESFDFEFVLEKDTRYDEKIYELYNYFCINNKAWKTINKMYLERFYRIKIINHEKFIEQYKTMFDGEYKNVSIVYDFSLYKNVIKKDMLALWNIKKTSMLTNNYIRTNEDMLLYEYNFLVDKDDYYLLVLSEEEAHSIYYKEENNLCLLSKNKEKRIFDLLKICNLDNIIANLKNEEFLISNENMSFLNSDVDNELKIRKIFNSYKFLDENLELVNVIFSTKSDKYLITKDYNNFIIKNKLNDTITLVVKISNEKYSYDFLNFIISEIRYIMKNYEIRGVEFEE